MAQALTFSEIVYRSYKATASHLKTYILGALALIVLSMVMRGVGGGLFALTDTPMVSDNIILALSAGLIGLVFTVAGVLLQILQTMYALIIAVDRTQNVKAGVKKAWKYLWRLLLGGIWIMLRSFAWISLLGIPFLAVGASGQHDAFVLIGILLLVAGAICAVWFLPRLAFLNIIQLKDGSAVRASGEASVKRTKGYWGKIVGNNILLGLSLALLTAGIVALGAVLSLALIGLLQAANTAIALVVVIPLGLVAVIALAIYFFGLSLFTQMYMVELYETIKANPKN